MVKFVKFDLSQRSSVLDSVSVLVWQEHCIWLFCCFSGWQIRFISKFLKFAIHDTWLVQELCSEAASAQYERSSSAAAALSA